MCDRLACCLEQSAYSAASSPLFNGIDPYGRHFRSPCCDVQSLSRWLEMASNDPEGTLPETFLALRTRFSDAVLTWIEVDDEVRMRRREKRIMGQKSDRGCVRSAQKDDLIFG